MPLIVIITISKLLLRLSRLFSLGGSALPGLVAERLDPAIGRKLAARLPHGSIIVTGTNGKTTTSKMLATILTDRGEHLVANKAGSNLSRGIVSTLIEYASLGGSFKQTMGLFEVDEAAMPAVAAMIQPKAIVVLNLFRDQLDRYGELNTTAQLIGKGIAATKADLCLNADDPLVASLASYAGAAHISYFGVEKVPNKKLAHDVTADSNNCPVCGEALMYTENYFGHIGHYRCKHNHFDRPQPAYGAAITALNEDSVTTSLLFPDKEVNAAIIPLPGLYNVYNALAAVAVAAGSGIAPSAIIQSVERVKAAFGRVEKLSLGGSFLYLLLIKNPTGFNQIIQTFLLNKKQQHILIIINDNFADGRDVSWLWDAAIEELAGRKHHVSVAGIRAADMALRLKYAGVDVATVEPSIKASLNQFVAQLPKGETGYVIPTYTAMLEARKILGKTTKLKGFWQ